MSRNRRIVRMFSFDNRSYSLFEKKFVAGYQFMKVERNGADTVYRIAWKDVVLILENPIELAKSSNSLSIHLTRESTIPIDFRISNIRLMYGDKTLL